MIAYQMKYVAPNWS